MKPITSQLGSGVKKGNDLNEVTGPVNKQGNSGGATPSIADAAKQVFF